MKISTYTDASPVSLTDRLIGTDVGGSPADTTKNFLLSDIQTLFKSGIALSDVLAAGNTATANIVLTGDITTTNLFALTAVTGTTITASGTVTATDVTATATVTGANVTAVGAVTGDAVIGLTAVSAPTITATGTVTGATVTATGTVNATTVTAATVKVTTIAKEFGAVSLTVDGTDLIFSTIPPSADNGTAVAAGIPTGGVYRTDGTGAAPLNVAGILMIVV